MATHSSTLSWKIPWMEEPGRLQSMGSRSRARLSDFTFTFHFHALEKEMATHSSVLAWIIPGTGEPGVHLLGSAGLHASLLDIGLFLCRLGARTLPGYLLLDGQGLEGRADCTACCPTWGRGALPALLALCLTLPRVGLASGVMNPGLTASIHSEYPGAVLHLK